MFFIICIIVFLDYRNGGLVPNNRGQPVFDVVFQTQQSRSDKIEEINESSIKHSKKEK